MTEILSNIITGAPGSYNMLSLEIEIAGKTNFERNPTIFHEYTHYIQNMTTISGFISLNKYLQVLLISFSKLGSDTVDPLLPLYNYSELQSVLGDNNIEGIQKRRFFCMVFDSLNNKYIFQSTDLDDYILSEQKHFSGMSSYNITYIAMDGKNIPINETTIKENMALVNSIIGGREQQNDALKENEINDILAYEYKEYNILFDFIDHYLPNCNLLKVVYCICEIGLNTSEEIVGIVLRLIQKKHIEFSRIETDRIINLIKKILNYDEAIHELFGIIYERYIKKTTYLFNSFDASTNQFIDIMKLFYNFMIEGIKYRTTQKTLYVQHLTNKYIQHLTSIIGCPIIYFRDENEYRNLSDTPDYFFRDFVYLHGTLKIFMELYKSYVTLCPFTRGNICKVLKNGHCYSDCLINYDDEVYKNCLLSNALNCSGIRQEQRKSRFHTE
jgi:hypothetical protein